jgi:DNA-binding SARP family transcriptional activator/TolB-like protein
MIELQTLGRLDLRAGDGSELSSIVAQPKRTALLVYLACAMPSGFCRRDTLVGVFWPELDQEHARAALRKALHYLRRSLGEEALIGRGDEELRLNESLVTCDAVKFDVALASNDPARAVELYRGAFMDGFFLADAPEFENWLERERARFRDRAFHAAWSLAEISGRESDAFGAAYWARRAAGLAPDDEAAVRRLMSLLDRLGDRAGAIAAYEDFARRIAAEYEMEPSAETRALARAIREETAIALKPTMDNAHDVAHAGPTLQPTPEITVRTQRAREPRGVRVFGSRRTTTVAAALLIIFTGAFGVWQRRAATAAEGVSPHVVAVLPFPVHGSNGNFAYLGEGIVSLLSTNLNGAGQLRAVDPAVLLSTISSAERVVLAPATARGVAARLGAGLFVLGDVVEAGGKLRISATMYDGSVGRPVSQAEAEGDANGLFAMVDELAGELLAREQRGAGAGHAQLAARTTHSLSALKAYLEGETQFRTGHYKEAIEQYQRAVAEDTTFALAYYRLAFAYSWASDTMSRPAAAKALRHSQRLSPADRLLVDALIPYLAGAADDAERRYRAILATYPFEGEAWYPLGEVLFHHNHVRGRPISEAEPVFRRALSLGPRDGPLTHLLEIAAITHDYVAFDSLFPGIERGAHFDLVGRVVTAFRKGSDNDRRRMLDEVRQVPEAELAQTARHMLFLLADRAAAEPIVKLLLEAQRPSEAKALGHVLLAHLNIAAGRWRAASADFAAAEQLDRARALENRGLLHALPFLRLPATEIASTRAALLRWNGSSDATSGLVFHGDESLHPTLRTYLLGLLNAQLGDREAALEFAAETERSAASPILAANLARGVRGRVAWQEGRAADALAFLEDVHIDQSAGDLMGIVPFYSQPLERFLRAEALHAAGREQEALGWYSSFAEHSPFGRVFLAPAALRQAEILAGIGRETEAVAHYTRFIELWRDADPELQPVVDAARRKLEQLRRTTR